MKKYSEYIKEYANFNNTQINPYLQRDIYDIRPVSDKQSVTSDKDIIFVEFKYKNETIKYDIKYDEIDKGTSDNIHWHIKKKHNNVTFDIHAQKSETGRYNVTIIRMVVDVYDNNKKIETITPKCCIKTTTDGISNKDINIDVHNI